MTSSSVALPRELRIGGGALDQIGPLVAMLGLSSPLIVTDRFLQEAGLVDRVLSLLEASGIYRTRVFADVQPDPTTSVVDAGVNYLKEGVHDCIIGLGGGSPIDTAKAISVLAKLGGPLRRYKAPHNQSEPGLPIIAIPTTAGTGSEATRFTVVTDDETQEKMLCAGSAFLPLAAIVDYELTLTKPKRLTADTGIDALTHAIEAFVSRRANAFSDSMAIQAMRAISPNLRTVFEEPQNRKAREAVMMGAMQAGIAFSNASVALVHGMSRPIGAHFHVPHGLSNAMLLPAVTRFSAPSALDRYAECARVMGVAGQNHDDAKAVHLLLQELQSLNRDLGVPSPAAYGIEKDDWLRLVPTMVEQAIASGSPANNPRVPSADEIQSLYLQTYNAP